MGLKMESGSYIGTKGSITSEIKFLTREDAKNSNYNAPPEARTRIKRYFTKTVKNSYKDLRVAKDKDGNYVCVSYKPGDVKGSHAVFVKVVSPRGETINFYKDSYDNKGNFLHRKIKIKNVKE